MADKSDRALAYCASVETSPLVSPFAIIFSRTFVNITSVNNGNCASTCAMFSTVMRERHNTKIGVFGGRPGQNIEFKGNLPQILEVLVVDFCR